MAMITTEAVAALLQVVMIDLVLAADNAIVIGLAAAGLPPAQRNRAIMIGIVAATALRIAFAALTTHLLHILGLMLAGGILLLWVCWKMWRELRARPRHPVAQDRGRDVGEDACLGITTLEHKSSGRTTLEPKTLGRKTLGQATLQIVVADVSMSLDNVLALAGAAREHPAILAFGLLLSVAFMGLGANWLARQLEQHRWVAYIGLAIIFYVAIDMILRGAHDLQPLFGGFGHTPT
jgi:YjbE family integral membrane protein